MWICHCAGANDGHIRQAVAGGARDEASVGEACGAGLHCGGCVPEVRRILDESFAGADA